MRCGRHLRPVLGAALLGAVLVACTNTSSNAGLVPTTLSIPPLTTTTGPAPTADDLALVTGLLGALYGAFLGGDYGAAVIGLDPPLVAACGGPDGLRAVQQAVRDGEGRGWRLEGVDGAEQTATGMRVRVRASVVAAAADVVLRRDQGGTVDLARRLDAPYGWVVTSALVPLGVADACGRTPPPGPRGAEPTEARDVPLGPTEPTTAATETTEPPEPRTTEPPAPEPPPEPTQEPPATEAAPEPPPPAPPDAPPPPEAPPPPAAPPASQ